MSQSIKMENRIAVITGASKGIGRSIAYRLGSEGYKLVLIARSTPELQKIQADLGEEKVLIFPADVSDENDVKKIIASTVEKWGSINVMINNAGMGHFKGIEEFTTEEYDQVMDVNVKGTFLFCREVIPVMRNAGGGHIINIASDVAKRTFASGSIYCASKFAQEALSSAMRKEVREDNIKVTVVYPGLVNTDFHEDAEENDERKTWMKAGDIAESVFYALNAPPHVVVDELMVHPLSQDY